MNSPTDSINYMADEIYRLRAANAELAEAIAAAQFELRDRQCIAPRLAATIERVNAALEKYKGLNHE